MFGIKMIHFPSLGLFRKKQDFLLSLGMTRDEPLCSKKMKEEFNWPNKIQSANNTCQNYIHYIPNSNNGTSLFSLLTKRFARLIFDTLSCLQLSRKEEISEFFRKWRRKDECLYPNRMCRQCLEREIDEWSSNSVFATFILILILLRKIRVHHLYPQLWVKQEGELGWQLSRRRTCLNLKLYIALVKYIIYSHVKPCIMELTINCGAELCTL